MAWLQQQQQLILRLPDHLARISRKLLNKEKGKTSPMVEIRPQDENEPSNDFIFVINGKEYPALLMNLPTPLETHKTFDNKIFLKAGDIGQVLQVFDTPEEREAARNKICKTLHGDYMPSGVTPPTADIVKRRFELTRKSETFLPYRIRAVIEEINSFGSGTGRMVPAHAPDSVGSSAVSGGAGGSAGGAGNAPGGMLEVVSVSTTEEVIDFEEWMVDTVSQSRRTGISITLSGSELAALKDISAAAGSSGGSSASASHNAKLSSTAAPLLLLLQHPEILVTEEEREEDQIDALAAEQAKEQRRKNSISLTVDEVSTQMDVVDAGASTTLTLPCSGLASAATGSSITTVVGASSNAASGSSDRGAGEPLKLSLSMRRPAASAAGASSSSASLATTVANTGTTSAAPVGQTSDQDVAMLQDEEGDENSADDAQDCAENGPDSDEEAPDPDAGGTIFDMLDTSDEEDAENNDTEAEGDGNDDEEGQDYDETAEDIAAESSAIASAYHAQMRATTQYASSNKTLTDDEAVDEDNGQEEGDAGNAGEDVDSVNSEDSDAWMREA